MPFPPHQLIPNHFVMIASNDPSESAFQVLGTQFHENSPPQFRHIQYEDDLSFPVNSYSSSMMHGPQCPMGMTKAASRILHCTHHTVTVFHTAYHTYSNIGQAQHPTIETPARDPAHQTTSLGVIQMAFVSQAAESGNLGITRLTSESITSNLFSKSSCTDCQGSGVDVSQFDVDLGMPPMHCGSSERPADDLSLSVCLQTPTWGDGQQLGMHPFNMPSH